jgi:uncharacterized protein (DUF2252 family)
MEDDLQVDPQRVALEEAIQLLKPLRQHRQASIERQQRQLQQSLASSRERLAETQERLGSERQAQQVRREALSSQHVNRCMSLDEVELWHNQERRMLDRLAHMRQSIHQQGVAIEQQQQQLQDMQVRVKEAQRAVEKLSCLAEAMNDES